MNKDNYLWANQITGNVWVGYDRNNLIQNFPEVCKQLFSKCDFMSKRPEHFFYWQAFGRFLCGSFSDSMNYFNENYGTDNPTVFYAKFSYQRISNVAAIFAHDVI